MVPGAAFDAVRTIRIAQKKIFNSIQFQLNANVMIISELILHIDPTLHFYSCVVHIGDFNTIEKKSFKFLVYVCVLFLVFISSRTTANHASK